MANMALDGWVPRRFSSLSDRLTSHYGVLMVGAAAIAQPALHRRLGGHAGDDVRDQRVRDLLAFAAGHDRFSWMRRHAEGPGLPRRFSIHALSFILCFSILIAVVILKFKQGAWVTIFVTGLLIVLCMLIHRHYLRMRAKLAELNAQLGDMQTLAGGDAVEHAHSSWTRRSRRRCCWSTPTADWAFIRC